MEGQVDMLLSKKEAEEVFDLTEGDKVEIGPFVVRLFICAQLQMYTFLHGYSQGSRGLQTSARRRQWFLVSSKKQSTDSVPDIWATSGCLACKAYQSVVLDLMSCRELVWI